MVILRPKLHGLVAGSQSRTLTQMEALGVGAQEVEAAAHTTVALALAPHPTPPQRLLAAACLDYLLRLDPLVREVHLLDFSEADILELRERVPLDVDRHASAPADYAVAVGHADNADLIVDANGWIAGIGSTLGTDAHELLNPVGPLAAAALAAGETFKTLFRLNHPDSAYARRFVATTGAFSFFDYAYDGANPPLVPLSIDAFLVGLGGVGAAVVRTLGELREHLSGMLRLVDSDVLSTDNLNRVTYARTSAAVERRPKVDEATDYLRLRTPNVRIEPHQMAFADFKRCISARRHERRYHTVVTGLDDDDARHEVQRDLPRVLIDGATGRDANVTVERSIVGEWGCLGCTRQMGAPADDAGRCDVLPEQHAPSVSFVSGLAGTLAAAELIKDTAYEHAALRGSFDHIFIYPPNPDLRTEPAHSPSCRINCSSAAVHGAYRRKYEDLA